MNLIHISQDDGLVTQNITDNLISQFISSQDVKQSSKSLYKRTLKQYFKWVDKHGLILKDISRAHIIAYKEELLADGKSSLSVGSYLTVVRSSMNGQRRISITQT